MFRKRAPGESFSRHERQDENKTHEQEVEQDEEDLLHHETLGRNRGVIAHPDQRKLVEADEQLKQGDEQTPEQRHAPVDPVIPEQEKQSETTAADEVENYQSNGSNGADQVVGRAHFLIAP